MLSSGRGGSLDSLARIVDAKRPTIEQRLAGVPFTLPKHAIARARFLYRRAQQGFALTPNQQFSLALACLRDCGLEPKTKQEEM